MNPMTKEEILGMAAGDEMDALVQEWVFGHEEDSDAGTWYTAAAKSYSTDESFARHVLRKMPASDEERFTVNRSKIGWIAKFDCRRYNGGNPQPRTPGLHVAEAAAMPLAVCRAALLAFASDEDGGDSQ